MERTRRTRRRNRLDRFLIYNLSYIKKDKLNFTV
jgi:hypothetical protein